MNTKEQNASTSRWPVGADELRPVTVERGFTGSSAGSVLIKAGRTTILCTASVSADVPPWLAGKGKGWVTAEYNMLPGSTAPRKQRDRLKVDGRTTEIQRLIGRSLRAAVDMHALGERLITVDCDVLEADGGTRTASITGGFIALVDAIRSLEFDTPPVGLIRDTVAAISVGVVRGEPVLDLPYEEDAAADVDMNIVMTGAGRFIELQGTGEGATFDNAELVELVALGAKGASELTLMQRKTLGDGWPL